MTPLSALYREKSDLAIKLLLLITSVTPLFQDWKVTLLFYSTVHRIQEYAALQGDVLPENHGERKVYVGDSLPEVFEAYKILYNLSRIARYDPRVKMTDDCVREAKELRLYVLSAIS